MVTWLSCAMGAVYLSAAFSGYLFTRLNTLERILFCLSAVLMFFPGMATSLAGLVLLLVVSVFNKKKLQSENGAEQDFIA